MVPFHKTPSFPYAWYWRGKPLHSGHQQGDSIQPICTGLQKIKIAEKEKSPCCPHPPSSPRRVAVGPSHPHPRQHHHRGDCCSHDIQHKKGCGSCDRSSRPHFSFFPSGWKDQGHRQQQHHQHRSHDHQKCRECDHYDRCHDHDEHRRHKQSRRCQSPDRLCQYYSEKKQTRREVKYCELHGTGTGSRRVCS